MSTAPIITDLQKINPSAIIELFTLTTDATLHGSAQTYRFHNGTSLNANGDIIWAGNQYLKMPIEAEGFAFAKGQLPRPTLTVSNALGTITAILLNVNQVTTGNDLTGATVTRIRTLARYLDAVNFPATTSTTTTTTTIADPADAETVTYTVTVHNPGSGNIFRINGVNNPVITMKRGSTYIFDQSDASNSGHPLAIKSDAGGAQTTTVVGTAGNAGATVTYSPAYPSAPNDLRYYCTSHGNNMGNTITMNDPNTIQQTTTSSSTTQTNPFGTPDPTAEFPQEIYFLDRKVTENRSVVTWEAQSALDLVNVKLPARIATKELFPGIGAFTG